MNFILLLFKQYMLGKLIMAILNFDL